MIAEMLQQLPLLIQAEQLQWGRDRMIAEIDTGAWFKKLGVGGFNGAAIE